jgi:hypothetical protein
MVINDEIEIAEGRIVGKVLKHSIRTKQLVDFVHFSQERQQRPIGIASFAAAAVRLEARCSRGELDVGAMATHRNHLRGFDHHDSADSCRLRNSRASHNLFSAGLCRLFVSRDEKCDRHTFRQSTSSNNCSGEGSLHVGAA